MFSNNEPQRSNQPLIEYSEPPFYTKIIPFERLTYKVDLKPDEIIDRIQQRTEPERFLRLRGVLGNNKKCDFEGTVEYDSFNISYISSQRKTAKIQAIGNVRAGINKSIIEVTLRPQIKSLLGIGIAVCFMIFNIGNLSFQVDSFFTGFLILSISFILGMFIYTFKKQARKTKEIFAEIFGTLPING